MCNVKLYTTTVVDIIVDIFMRSGDNRDRSVKLREIAPNFGF